MKSLPTSLTVRMARSKSLMSLHKICTHLKNYTITLNQYVKFIIYGWLKGNSLTGTQYSSLLGLFNFFSTSSHHTQLAMILPITIIQSLVLHFFSKKHLVSWCETRSICCTFLSVKFHSNSCGLGKIFALARQSILLWDSFAVSDRNFLNNEWKGRNLKTSH